MATASPKPYRDAQLKRERGYVEKKSIVWSDGREKLVGRDWVKRKKELHARCGGRCEFFSGLSVGSWVEGVRCASMAEDPHHIIPRSQGRNDSPWNLMALCRKHHDMLDKRKPRWTKKVQ
jgi:predicted restriction endonuclease